ncbi:pectate lyase b [Ophiostoma piceae UAMH 11346]|uniref:Pectate lyase b n=1 Tax=Ophiostoma piceae (strain UAMH 11346) TaxID=1262450 RepID=S3BYT8_OPHP1|nr:pectate lyase b [Ophiostoma piceae UAMH 11346]
MHSRVVFMSLVAGALACANPKTNACAKSLVDNVAAASAFCSTATSGSAVPAFASSCSTIKNVLKECVCQFSTAAAPAPAATSAAATTPATTEAAATTTPVAASGDSEVAASGSAIGFAAGTTGGGSGAGTTVTTCTALSSALDAGGVIRISGILTGCGILDVPSDTSVIGVGAGSGLEDGGFRVKKATNVIIQNLKMHNPPVAGDLIAIQESTLVWIDHMALSTDSLASGDKDLYDGMVDMSHAADMVTVSFCTFKDHFKVSLVGHSDNNGAEDTGFLHVTYHNNYWNNVSSRTPSIRFGTGHIFNNCYEDVETSGINSRMGAQVLVEGNAFVNVKRAIITNLDSDEPGFAVEKNNLFTNSDIAITQQGSFAAPYAYTVAAPAGICASVKAAAGPSASL